MFQKLVHNDLITLTPGDTKQERTINNKDKNCFSRRSFQAETANYSTLWFINNRYY